jgi:hypothetical protein
MGKRSYHAKLAKGWKHSWHYDGPLGNALCGRSSGLSTNDITIVNCKLCLDKMLKERIINEETYTKLLSNPGTYIKGSI